MKKKKKNFAKPYIYEGQGSRGSTCKITTSKRYLCPASIYLSSTTIHYWKASVQTLCIAVYTKNFTTNILCYRIDGCAAWLRVKRTKYGNGHCAWGIKESGVYVARLLLTRRNKRSINRSYRKLLLRQSFNRRTAQRGSAWTVFNASNSFPLWTMDGTT